MQCLQKEAKFKDEQLFRKISKSTPGRVDHVGLLLVSGPE